MANTYLVTGAAGFIGSKTAETLLKEDNVVIGIDNLNSYYDPTLKHHRLKALEEFPHFSFHQLDVEDREGLETIFAHNKLRAVYNLAARAGVRYSIENPSIYFDTNTRGMLNLLELMAKHDVPKITMASTSSVYAGQAMPFKETLAVNNPISPYAASKKAAEVLAYTYHHLYGLDVSILRYFTVYGPMGRPDMSIFRFIKWIHEGRAIDMYGDGTQSRDFTFVDDITRGTIAAERDVGYEIFNLGGGNNPIPMLEVIQTLEQLIGKQASIKHHEFHKADMMTTWADITQANKVLDWTPSISLEEGLEASVKWYLDNLEWASKIQV